MFENYEGYQYFDNDESFMENDSTSLNSEEFDSERDEFDLTGDRPLNVVDLMFKNAARYSIMSPDMEYELGLILEEAEEKLEIAENVNKNFILYPNLRLEKIFLSVKTVEELDNITRIRKIPYLLNDDLILVKEIGTIKKFLRLSSNGILTLEELKKQFPELCFDGVTPVEDLSSQLQLLEKYITAKFNFYYRNLRLVFNVAKKISDELPYEDRIQEGSIGLVKAINHYKASLGYRFSTYAVTWIKQTARRGVFYSSSIIKLPVHFAEKVRKYRDFVSKYISIYGVEPSLEVCMATLKMKEEEVRNAKLAYLRQYMTSMDAPLPGTEEYSSFGEFIKDENINIEDNYMSKECVEFIKSTIELIASPRDSEVLMDRWGLNDEEIVYTLEEIGRKNSITRERVRQIERKYARKIRRKLIENGFENN